MGIWSIKFGKCVYLAGEIVQNLKIIFEGFAATVRIVNKDVFCAKPDQGKAHSHAMVFVGVDRTCSNRSGINGDVVLSFLAPNVQFTKFCGNGMKTVAFLESDMADAGNGDRSICKRSQTGKGNSLVGEGRHIDFTCL